MPEICTLVNHYITSTSVNFRTEPQTDDDWLADWSGGRSRYPWLVAEASGQVVGLAYGGPWKSRAAYDWLVEVTAYVAHDRVRGGVGQALYRELLSLLDRQGYHSQVAVITLPNAASVAFHEHFGFTAAGRLKDAGFKNGRWYDVGFWHRVSEGGAGPAPRILSVDAL